MRSFTRLAVTNKVDGLVTPGLDDGYTRLEASHIQTSEIPNRIFPQNRNNLDKEVNIISYKRLKFKNWEKI